MGAGISFDGGVRAEGLRGAERRFGRPRRAERHPQSSTYGQHPPRSADWYWRPRAARPAKRVAFQAAPLLCARRLLDGIVRAPRSPRRQHRADPSTPPARSRCRITLEDTWARHSRSVTVTVDSCTRLDDVVPATSGGQAWRPGHHASVRDRFGRGPGVLSTRWRPSPPRALTVGPRVGEKLVPPGEDPS